MKAILILMVLASVSCGQNYNSCRSREHMRIQCQAEQMPNYGRVYAGEICNRSYEAERCY
jgi:hypothetical protein